MKNQQIVRVCQHTTCQNNGSKATLAAFLSQAPAGVVVTGTDCLGLCNMGPSVYVEPDSTWYCRVRAEDVSTIVQCHLNDGQPVQELLHPRYHPHY
ncbi:MAG: (2Fe-2S) ferredoxin domain-containing protein [Cyanobacteria bacterium]|nr:(2Fe-2S) ferredoxin domain-containing protein [Cyanobacteriota bacterium]MDW8201133.1 (2Fe-2S) ferredoxin domain-containing protein [Cyanobacteriota bacterium SKYGB_h_bin112]